MVFFQVFSAKDQLRLIKACNVLCQIVKNIFCRHHSILHVHVVVVFYIHIWIIKLNKILISFINNTTKTISKAAKYFFFVIILSYGGRRILRYVYLSFCWVCARGFNGTVTRLHLVMAHNRGAKDFGPCWQRAAGAFKIYFASWVVVGRAVVSNGKKSVDDSTRRQGGEGGKLAFDIHVYFHVKCRSPLQWWYHAPQNIHRRLKWSQLGRHFIVNLLLLFVRLTAPHRRCRDRQDIFCRLLTLTGRSRRGFSFYLI